MRWPVVLSALCGVVVGWGVNGLWWRPGDAKAANDRWQEFALATGAIQAGPVGHDQDGIWVLDGKNGKLYASSISRLTGKVLAWAEVDLLREFGLANANDARFLMTTGQVGRGASVLFVAEVASGRLGVYSMSLAEGQNPGVIVRRHDLVAFRPSLAR
ncbi:hypothetical protein HRbin36_01624 [bacterium HR36]|nr:hypothetical protein HRbin36_01624 [bacterium HR36]